MPSDKDVGNADSEQTDVFDLDRIRKLIELMKEHDLSEVDLRHARQRIRMRRGSDQTITTTPAMNPVMASPATVPLAPETAPALAAVDEEKANYIRSPMVGTFYTKPKPEEPTFVKVGDYVQPDTVVCLIEAMKMFNEIPAGISGRILGVLVNNEEAVDVNKPLFKIEPS